MGISTYFSLTAMRSCTLKGRVFCASGIKNPKNIKKRLKAKFVFLKDNNGIKKYPKQRFKNAPP